MRSRIILVVVVLLLLACGLSYRELTKAPPAALVPNRLPSTSTPQEPLSAAQSEDEKTRHMLVGVWQDNYRGKRTMTLKADGTGTMLVELRGIDAALFAAKLRFDMQWTLRGMKLTKRTVGGEPADKVNLILNTMGSVTEETILELTEQRLHVLDRNGKTRYDWRRLKLDE